MYATEYFAVVFVDKWNLDLFPNIAQSRNLKINLYYKKHYIL